MKIDSTNTKTNSIAKYLWSGHKISTMVGWKRFDKKVKKYFGLLLSIAL